MLTVTLLRLFVPFHLNIPCNKTLSEKIIYNRFAKFRRGCASVCDESREGRPKSVVIPNSIDAMHKIIEEGGDVRHRQI